MSDIHERLSRIYGARTVEDTTSSWIPKRSYRKGDVLAEIAEKAPPATGLSQKMTEDILQREAFLAQGREAIRERVSVYLLDQYGDGGHEWRMTNFEESWSRMWEKYGEDLTEALVGELEGFDERPFVNFAGYIDKEILKEAVKSVLARRGCA